MHRWGNKKDMAGDDPPYLSVGTEVSAKYKGAFCEAKIRNVVKSVKCKIQYKNEQGSAFVYDEQIKGLLMPGAVVEVKIPDKKEIIEGTIVKIQDLSQYTVVFDDGDIATLRRTALCLKSGRHFAESETLDQLPLTHPEHFSTPVVSGVRGSRRRDDMDDSDEEGKHPKVEREEDMGKVVCVEIGDKKKSKDNWFPGLVVAPNAQDSVKIDVEEEYLVRSFKDGRYYTVPKNETTDFTRDIGNRVENVTLKQAVEKAISFLDKNDLPAHWDREQLFRQGESCSETDASDTDSMDDEPREEKDHFVAQLYKFMDDRGTPINKGPIITSKDVDLYKLFKIVYKFGGYNRVTNRSQWKSITLKLGFAATQTSNVKAAYKKYLHSFEEFYRKLGCTLLPRTDNKLRSRSSRPLIRDRDNPPDKILLDKDENSSSTNEDTSEIKPPTTIKTTLLEFPATNEENNIGKYSSEEKKEMNTKVKARDPSTESITDRKTEIIVTKEIGSQQCSVRDIKEEKLSTEKRTERKSVKIGSKMDETTDKKADKTSLKTTKLVKNSKPVEKRIKKTESALKQMKEKRSLKERMKAIVHKLKLKSTNTSEQKKKKQKPSEELNKFLSQGLRIKLKDEFAPSSIKSRKLSAGSNESKIIGVGQNNEKKVTGPSVLAASCVIETNLMNSASLSKMKRSDEEGNENFKRKSTSRKRKDDDKLSNNSSEAQMCEAVEFVPYYKSICIGDKLKVYYESTNESKVTYEAKVTNKRYGSGTGTEYLVHYTGWNTRYDEWIKRSRIADNLSWTPARAKRKSNQLDASVLPGNQSSASERTETQPAPNQNVGKTEKFKRASQSPVAKNRSKISIKSGVKQMKNMKNKFDSKSKKFSAQKVISDNDSESENENHQKEKELQKTRSRTEKQKLQEGETTSTKESGKDVDVKKKVVPALKRTRSGSIKLEHDKDSTKKRKLSPSTGSKNSKPSAVRNSIIKSLMPRKRVSARTKESKDGKTSPTSNEMYDNKMEEHDDMFVEDVKPVVHDCMEAVSKSDDEKDVDDKTFILKIASATSDKSLSCETDGNESAKATMQEVEPAPTSSTVSEEGRLVTPQKGITVDEEMAVSRIAAAQSFTDSYLAENLELKPKMVKTKQKRDSEEKNTSPSKLISRSPAEKVVTKPMGEVREKTIFTSRSPCEKKNEKTPEKDGKLRNVNTFTSYLNMDKIDFIKKGSVVEKNEKCEKSAIVTKTTDSMYVKSVDDIYEFNEPEPVAIDDRTILHRRATPRIFEDNTVKRTKLVTSTVDSIRELDESCKLLEDTIMVETKAIPVREVRSAADNKREDIEMRSTNSLSEKDDVEEHTSDEETINEEVMKADISLESVKSIILQNSPVECRNCDSPSFVHLKNNCTEDSNGDKSDDDDADNSKLVISEASSVLEKMEEVKSVITHEVLIGDSGSEESNAESVVPRMDEEIGAEVAYTNESSDEDVCDKVTKKTNLPEEEEEEEPVTKTSSNQSFSESRVDKKFDEGNQIHISSLEDVAQETVINEIVVEVSVSGRKDESSSDKKNEEAVESMETDDNLKTKYEEDVSDALLLCKETIPKSPEAKDVIDTDIDYSCTLRVPTIEGKRAVDPQLARVKKEGRTSLLMSPNETPPTTPEGTNSTPGTSPSEEVSGFSSATFSLNEKSGSNKDSSENETSSDASEKPTKVKKYSNEVYAKKNAYEFDTYLKNQAEQGDLKSEEMGKKKNKSFSETPGHGNDKDDSNDVSSSTQEGDLSKAKSSIAYILAQIPSAFDSNQRIEFLEQKQEEIRKKYMHYKQEVATIDKKRKKLRRKQREGRMMTRNEANSLLS